jgi:hypothetical protein
MKLVNLSLLDLSDLAYTILRSKSKLFYSSIVQLVIIFLVIPAPMLAFYILSSTLRIFYFQRFPSQNLTQFSLPPMLIDLLPSAIDFFILNFGIMLFWAILFQFHTQLLFNRSYFRTSVLEVLDPSYKLNSAVEHSHSFSLILTNALVCYICQSIHLSALYITNSFLQQLAFLSAIVIYLVYLCVFQFTSYLTLDQKQTFLQAINQSLQLFVHTWRQSLKIFLLRTLSVFVITILGAIIFVSILISILNAAILPTNNTMTFFAIYLCYGLIQIPCQFSLIYSSILQYLYYLQLKNKTQGIEMQSRLNSNQHI